MKNPKPTHPNELIEKGDFPGAVDLLESLLSQNPSDEYKRLLAHCYKKLEHYPHELQTLSSIQNKTFNDYLLAGSACLQTKNWDHASKYLKQALKVSLEPEAYYLLAVAEAKGLSNYALNKDKHIKKAVLATLKKAIALPTCPPEPFLWLAELQDWDNTGRRKKQEFLEAGLIINPQSKEIRLNLAELHLNWTKDVKNFHEVLSPLLTLNPVPPLALWFAFQESYQSKHYDQALNYLEALERQSGGTPQVILHAKGDTLVHLGHFEAAIHSYHAMAQEEYDEEHFFWIQLSCAWVRLKQGKISEAIEDISNTIEYYLDLEAANGEPLSLDGFTMLMVGQSREHYGFDVSIPHVCQEFLKLEHNGIVLDQEVKAGLFYLHAQFLDHEDLARGNLLRDATTLSTNRKFHQEYIAFLFYYDNPAKALEHHLTYYLQSWHNPKTYGSFTSETAEFDYELGEKPQTQQRRSCHKVALKFLDQCENDKQIQVIFIPLYHSFWGPLLKEGELWKETVELTSFLSQKSPKNTTLLFDLAYSLAKLHHFDQAEEHYRNLLDIDPKDSSVLNNLSLLLEQKGNFTEASELSERGKQLQPSDERIADNWDRIQKRREEHQRQTQRQEDFIRTAPERWPQLDYYKKQLLGALSVIQGFDDWEHLAQLTGIDEKYLAGHWRKLIDLGMILEKEEKNKKTYEVNSHITSLIKQERSHTVVTKVIHAESNIAFRPIFNSSQEYTIYNILIGLFPNHLVFPNMGLQTLFQYDRMKELLTSEEFRYFLMAQVDFCITSTANYLPIVGFEVDSRYHDTDHQQDRDDKKDRIFQVGGVPLLRLRARGKPSEQASRKQIIEAVRNLGQELTKTHREGSPSINLRMEIDFETFGR